MQHPPKKSDGSLKKLKEISAGKKALPGMKPEKLFNDVKRLIKKKPYYGLVLARLSKYVVYDDNFIPTAGVWVDLNTLNYNLAVNFDWYFSYPENIRLGLLQHECLHVLWNHSITMEKQSRIDHNIANIAQDIEINQYIDRKDLPADGGQFFEDFVKAGFLKSKHSKKGSVFYFNELIKNIPKCKTQSKGIGKSGGSGGKTQEQNGDSQNLKDPNNVGSPMDVHFNAPKEMNNVQEEIIKRNLHNIIKDVQDTCSKLQGHVPGFSELLLEMYKRPEYYIPWYNKFKTRVTSSIIRRPVNTRYRKSRRFLDAEGTKYIKLAHVLLAVDTSGSMGEADLNLALNQMDNLKRQGMSYDVLNCDTQIVGKPIPSRKVDVTKFKFGGRGGTDFNEPLKYLNQSKNKYSGCIYVTDGYANVPSIKTVKPVVWLVCESGKPLKDMEEFPGYVIKMSNHEKT